LHYVKHARNTYKILALILLFSKLSMNVRARGSNT